ncbi:hypothetical protein U1Q18_036921 [Sarracenia purpurea var. burkii]
MKQNGVEPNNLTFPFVAKACGKLSNLRSSETFHTHVVKSPFQSDMYVQTALVDMYVKCDYLDFAYNVFERMVVRDVTSWNVMLGGFAQLGLVDKVSVLFNQMTVDGIRPDWVMVMALTQLGSDMKDLKLVNAIHCFGIRTGVEADVSVANTWVAAYSKCGDLGTAEIVFGGIDLGFRTVVSWNAMLSGYAHLKEPLKAISLYKRMLSDGPGPDGATIVTLLSSCVKTEELYHGKSIHGHGIQLGCILNIPVLNTLISMYANCGDIDSARFLFDNMIDRTRVSWTAIIGGYAEKGKLDEALALFHSMEAAGQKPDLVTVLHLISGCGQTGALEIGRWIDNYTISNMLKDDVMVCNALIDIACKNHENVELGEYAAHRLFEMEPWAAAPYVEMANLYASTGRWDGVAATRTMMKGNQVTKSPGQSLVRVNGKSRTFTAEDRSHPEGLLVYELLDGLALNLKEEKDSSVVEEIWKH